MKGSKNHEMKKRDEEGETRGESLDVAYSPEVPPGSAACSQPV